MRKLLIVLISAAFAAATFGAFAISEGGKIGGNPAKPGRALAKSKAPKADGATDKPAPATDDKAKKKTQ